MNKASDIRRRIAGAPLLLAALFVADANAHHLVPRHELRCGDTFPCPAELQRRVDFWVMVFRSWTTGQVIFHDTKRPERVYKVVDTRASCRRRGAPREIERHRSRIGAELRAVATKLEQGGSNWSAADQHLLGLFPRKDPAEIRAAASNIRCQQGNRDRFEKALWRSGAYRDMIAKELSDAGLPADIVYLPFVESAYNPNAYSSAGAAGLWQIMPGTARTLGLEVSATLDERMDPEAATRAAARYFRQSTGVLRKAARAVEPGVRAGELNPFVITSYNYGIAGMRRAVEELGPDFITVLERYRSRSFRTAVRNFYASFLAARHVAGNAERYFGRVKYAPALRHHTVVLKQPTSVKRIEQVFGVGQDELKELNRAWTRYIWHGWRFVPEGYRLRLPARRGGWSSQVARLESLPREREDWAGQPYVVKRGDTACGIAQALRVRCRDLIDANALGKGAVIRVGQKLVIPRRNGSGHGAATVAGSTATRYRVRPGDTACGVAQQLGVDCRALIAENDLGRSAMIRVGQLLRVPGAGGQRASASTATSYRVRRGDTACGIARKLRVDCRALIAENRLGRRALIREGQVLRLPGSATPASAPPAPTVAEAGRGATEYTVRRGDTVCGIAERTGVDCRTVLAKNGLDRRGFIRVGQVLTIPGGAPPRAVAVTLAGSAGARAVTAEADLVTSPAAARTDAAASVNGSPPALAQHATVDPEAVLDAEFDYSIKRSTRGGRRVYTIRAEPDETLGHYADWLGQEEARAIRRVNGMRLGATLRIGQTLTLPIDSDQVAEQFVRHRADYHRVLVEEFKEYYEIVGLDSYRVKAGDSLWEIAREFELPLWVVERFNEGASRALPAVGASLTVPRVQSRSEHP